MAGSGEVVSSLGDLLPNMNLLDFLQTIPLQLQVLVEV